MRTAKLPPILVHICFGGLAAGVSPAPAAFPGENGKIAFASDRNGGNMDIWTMGANGRHPVDLTADSGGFDIGARWRADGHKLVFQSDRTTAANPEGDTEIFVMNANGSHQTQITFNALDDEFPSWSSDGRIVFARDLDPFRGQIDEDIFTMNADGTDQRNVTNTPGVDVVAPRPADRVPQRPHRRVRPLRHLHHPRRRRRKDPADLERRLRRLPGTATTEH
jgi:Tol biopolymer transport system component